MDQRHLVQNSLGFFVIGFLLWYDERIPVGLGPAFNDLPEIAVIRLDEYLPQVQLGIGTRRLLEWMHIVLCVNSELESSTRNT